VSKHCLLLFVSYICYWHFHETAVSNLNAFLFRFSIIMNETNTYMIIMWYINPLKKLNIFPFKFNACWNSTYTITLGLLRIILFISLLYMYDGSFNFSMLTALQPFNFNLMTNKSAQHWKVLQQLKFFCFKSTYFNTSRFTYHSVAHFDNKPYSQAFSCAKTPNYCCVILTVCPKFLRI